MDDERDDEAELEEPAEPDPDARRDAAVEDGVRAWGWR
jgi:hypothetical protein